MSAAKELNTVIKLQEDIAIIIASTVWKPKPDMSGDLWKAVSSENKRKAMSAAQDIIILMLKPLRSKNVKS